MPRRIGDQKCNDIVASSLSVSSLNVTSNNINGIFLKGDILTSDGTTLTKIPVGCDGLVLTADSNKDIGMSWSASNNGDAIGHKLSSLDNYLYNFELNNTPIILTNSDFVGGTYRIKNSGVYKLGENIVFNPNPSDDHMPTQQQIDNGDYPIMPDGPYHLGFFAAIAIEVDNVVIDLNGFRIDQHIAHQLQQRFFSVIELGGSPFIPTQGPSNFGDVVSYPNKVLIHNGTIGKSSHHGIHGNLVTDLIMSDLVFTDFELAGWSLNGSNNVLVRNVHVHHNELNFPVLATYSQSRFIRSFLKKIISDNGSPGPSILIKGVTKTGLDILNELETAMSNVYNVVVNNIGTLSDHSDAVFYENTNIGLDGGIYGGSFNTSGVLVHDFIHNRDNLNGNENIKMINVTIEDLQSTPMEIVGLSANDVVNDYGMKLQKGPVGDVFRILDVTNIDGSYKPNVLANAQVYVSKIGVGAMQRGGSNIDNDVITWASGNDTSIGGTHYYICNGDSMSHIMKGNIGLFLSGVTNFVCEELTMRNLINHGSIGENENPNGVNCSNDDVYEGNNNRGLALVSSKNCYVKNSNISTIQSVSGDGMNYDYIGENINITIN